MKHAWVHSTQGRKRSTALWVVCLGFVLLLLVLALPIVAGAEVDVIGTCLDPCHVPPGFMGPDVETAYLGAGENAGHSMDWNARVVADSSGAVLPQGSRMPCSECHVTHGTTTTNIYLFDSTRAGAPITTIRQLCEGCHVPYDSEAGPAVVSGLVLKKLPPAPVDHGEASNRACSDCHGGGGHGPGSHSGGVSCGDPACHGATGSHAIHLSESDPRGPGELHCYDCHEPGGTPAFATGSDEDESGDIEFDETTVCDECHSPGGDYDGVDSAMAPTGAMSVGARDYWDDGVYETTATLKPDMERWCAGCHDEDQAVIQGITAPNIVGDEDRDASYGTGYGFYTTGHGRDTGFYPATEAPAADTECDACHSYEWKHIDGDARTYVSRADYSGLENQRYQDAYRLRDVGGGEPMDVPRTGWGFAESDSALCFECHDSAVFMDQYDYRTNFRSDPTTTNSHWYHLQGTGPFNGRWDSDWSGSGDSMDNCPACHNVHGSPSPAMVRHGELISTPGTTDKVSSLDLKYWPGSYPTLADSQGGVTRFIGPGPGTITKNGICTMCHNDTFTYTRTPTDLYPPRFYGAYGTAGSATVTVTFNDGIYSSPGGLGDLVPSDFSLTDIDDGRSITDVTHSAGGATAHLTLSSALDSSDDVGIDLISMATTASAYDVDGTAMTTATVTISGDTTPPVVSYLTPTPGATEVAINTDLLLEISDAGIGVDSTTLEIQLTGDKGYSQTYTDANASVSVTGTPGSYRVVVTPETPFSQGETITVTVSVDDLAGNAAVSPLWAFTAAPGIHWQTPESLAATDTLTGAGALIDNDLTTGNAFTGGPAHSADYLIDEGGDLYAIDSVRLYGSTMIRTWTAYVSTDTVTWTSVTSGWTVGGTDQWYEYELPTPKTARYLRIYYFLPGPQPANVVTEFQFLGVSVPDTYTAPSLDWTGETGYVSDGADPDGVVAGESVEFRVDYADADGQMPEAAEVWVDIDDSGSYEASETFAMTETDAGDADTTDGKRYTRSVAITEVGDGSIDYRFFAEDDTVRAAGPPVAGGSLVVVPDAILDVPTEYPTIQAAIDSAFDGWTVRAADGTYPENITLRGKEITVRSANGAASTTIEGSATVSSAVVTFDSGETTASVLQDFTIDNAAAHRGAYIANSRPTIRGCVFEGNGISTASDGGAFFITGATGGAVIEDCVIGGDPSNPNIARDGAGVWQGNYPVAPCGDLTIRRTLISDNSGRQGALYAYRNTTGRLVVEETTITANTMTLSGGGIMLSTVYQEATFTDVVVTDNTTVQYGGGLHVYNSHAVLDGCTFSGNKTTLYDGGAISLMGNSSETTVVASTLTSNTARYGGGISFVNSTNGRLSIVDSAIEGNSTFAGNGGGVRLQSIGNVTSISGSSISSNTAKWHGGGIFAQSAPVSIFDSSVDRNSTGPSLYNGGGLYLRDASTTSLIDSCTVSANEARDGGGILITLGADVTIVDSRLEGNVADDQTTADGGGVHIAGGGSTLDVSRSILAGNRARAGGGLAVLNSAVATMTNCTISGNAADVRPSNYGGGVYSNSNTTLLNCTISGNRTIGSGAGSGYGGGIWHSGTMAITNCIVYGNEAADGGSEINGSPTVTYSDVLGGFAGTGNIDVAPSFVATVAASAAPTTTGDYHLQDTSPCEGQASATYAPADDIDGGSRPAGTGDDMGSDEIDSVGASMAMDKPFVVSLPRTGPIGEQPTRVTSVQSSKPTALEVIPAGSGQPDTILGTSQTAASGAGLPRDAGAPLESAVAPHEPAGEAPPRSATIPVAMGFASIAGLALRKILAAA